MKKEIILKDRLSLKQRLKELAETECSVEATEGAMCYEPSCPSPKDYVCPVCGHKTKQNDHIIQDIKSIRTIVKQIKTAGYDVILDEREFCENCSNRKEPSLFAACDWWLDETKINKYPVLKFKIRYNADSKYHIAKSNIIYEYKCVLEFLKGYDFYEGERDAVEPIRENMKILQKMLGIGKDIIPPKRHE